MARRSAATTRFRHEVDSRFPSRPRTSDGWIGDARHRNTNSDHNPNSAGVVQAEDVTLLREEGEWLFNYLRILRDPRTKYVIFNGRMFSSYATSKHAAWAIRPYSGLNAHKTHLHLSVQDSRSLYDDGSTWGISSNTGDTEEQVLRRGDKGNSVLVIQQALKDWSSNALPQHGADGDYGAETESEVKRYQKAANLSQTGAVDGVTAALLLRHSAPSAGLSQDNADKRYLRRGESVKLG